MMWKPWSVEIVGRESGLTFTVDFMRFWTQRQADLWCMTMNMAGRHVGAQREVNTLTYYRSVRRVAGRWPLGRNASHEGTP